jgi:prepilin-type N-terminal cleavage/methylation domain-containing protein
VTRPTRQDLERGFTLVELIISSMLLVIVLTIVGAILASTTSTSKTVNSVTTASTAGQLVADSVERGIRNSSDFHLTTPTGTDQLLVARTAQGGATINWVCEAWYYSSAGGGTIRYTTSTTIIPGAPTMADLTQWTLLDTGLIPASGTGIFSTTGTALNLAFNGLAGNNPPVTILSSVLSRAGSSGTPACY